MRRAALILTGLALVLAGCGGAEEGAPLPETVQGTVEEQPQGQQGETQQGETEQGETEQGETEQGETEQGETEQGETEQGGTQQGGNGGAQGDPAAGKTVFAASGCTGCHTLEAAGAQGTVGPNLDESQPSYDEAVTRVANGGNGMPAFKGRLTEKQIRDVSAFVVQSAQG